MVEETGLPFTIAYTNRRDFYLQMRLKEDAPLPTQIDTSCLINLVRKANTISCTTRNLVSYSVCYYYNFLSNFRFIFR